jgi:hypothetical protein
LDSQGRESPNQETSVSQSLASSVVAEKPKIATQVNVRPTPLIQPEVIQIDDTSDEEDDEDMDEEESEVSMGDRKVMDSQPRPYLAPPSRKLYRCINKKCRQKFYSSNRWSAHVEHCDIAK